MATVDLPSCTSGFHPLLSGRTCAKPSHGWRWVGVMVLSVLLHGLAWQGRGWLAHTPAPIQKPKPPVVLTLLPPPKPEPPKPVVEPPKPLPPAEPPAPMATAKPAPAAKPVPITKQKPVPVAPQKVASKPPPEPVTPAMPRVKTPPAPPKAVKGKPLPPAEAMGPVAPPVVVPPPAPRAEAKPLPHHRSVQPTRRELEEDPNLPPVTQAPKPLTAQPPLRRPAPPVPVSEPEPLVRSRAQTAPRPGIEQLPTRAGETLERRSIAAPASPSRSSSAAGPMPRSSAPASASTSTSASRSASSSAANASPAGGTASSAFEGAKANAAYLHNPKPEYPALAMRRQWEGKVVLKVRVLADGTVAAVTVATSSGHEVLDEAALEAVRAWHFVPAKQGGKAVESTVNVPINFNLLDAQ